MIITTRYDLGDIVFLITDIDQQPRIISQIRVVSSHYCEYLLSLGANNSWHSDFEFTKEKNITLKYNFNNG